MEITLNGQPVTVMGPTLSYEEIVALAGMSGTPTVAVSQDQRGPGGRRLKPGDVVTVHPEMQVGCVDE